MINFFIFGIIFFVCWKMNVNRKYCTSDREWNVYKGNLLQGISVRSHDTGYFEIGFHRKITVPPMGVYSYVYSKDEFHHLIHCLKNNIPSKHKSKGLRTLKIVSAPKNFDALITETTYLSWQQRLLQRKPIDELISDYEANKI